MERDKTFFMNFVIKNSYPKYKDVLQIIRKQEDRFDMFAEYGELNHEWMKEIYENALDKDIVKANGEKINERGDKEAMVWNYYTLLAVVNHLLKKSGMKNEDVMFIHYNFRKLVSGYWDGVGDWLD